MDCRLYLITPPRLDDVEAFDRILAEALDAGDVAAVQFRFKPASDDEIRAWTARLLPTVQTRGVMALMNDRPDLARELGCDGVHIGAEDASIAEARRILGPGAVIGVTCKDSRHLAMEAAEAGCDYVAFGAFFDTTTKATDARPEPDILTIWQEVMETPCVAIGGITVDNAAPLVAAGADYLAVSAGVWRHADGPAAAVRAFGTILTLRQ